MANTPTTSDVTFNVTEPTTNTDGSPLTNLAKTRIDYTTSTPLGNTLATVDVPASGPTGGQAVSKLVAVPIGAGQQGTVTATAKAVNVNNLASPVSNTATKTIDRRAETLAPAPPVNLSIA